MYPVFIRILYRMLSGNSVLLSFRSSNVTPAIGAFKLLTFLTNSPGYNELHDTLKVNQRSFESPIKNNV